MSPCLTCPPYSSLCGRTVASSATAKPTPTRTTRRGSLRTSTSQNSADTVTIDFITKLPLSKDTTTGLEYETVLTVVGRLTKWAYFLPFKETWSATQLADVISRSVASTHGVLAGAHEAPRNEEQERRARLHWHTTLRRTDRRNDSTKSWSSTSSCSSTSSRTTGRCCHQ